MTRRDFLAALGGGITVLAAAGRFRRK